MWTDPGGHVWTTGEMVTAANMNTYIKDNLLAIWLPPSCRAFHNANVSIANNTWVSIPLNSERWNYQSMHSTSTNNSRMTVPTGWAGRYLLTASIEFATAAGSYRQVRFLKNGSSASAVTAQAPSPFNHNEVLATEIALAAADYMELQAWQATGAAINVVTNAQWSPEFTMSLVGG